MYLVRNMLSKLIFFSLMAGLLGLLSSPGYAVPIDLNDFEGDAGFGVDPSTAISIAADGSSATINEVSSVDSVFLYNDPGFFGPNVIIPGANMGLFFDFELTMGALDLNEFSAVLFDVDGSILDSSYEFFTSTAGSGSVFFDLSSLTGLLLGMEFALFSIPGDDTNTFSANVTISNLRIEELSVAVPESASLWLLSGFILVFLVYSSRIRNLIVRPESI